MKFQYQSLEKICAGAFIGFCILGLVFGSEYIFLSVFSLLAASGFLFYGAYRHPCGFKSQRQLTFFIWFSCIPAALWVVGKSYFEEKDVHQFRNYLSAHQCRFKGDVVVRTTNGGCDRFGNCSEAEEFEEPEYYCATTRNRITFTDFRDGRYGYK